MSLPKKKFIIITVGRSGSTYFQALLNTDPDCECAGESYGGTYLKKLYQVYKNIDSLKFINSYSAKNLGIISDKKHPYYSSNKILKLKTKIEINNLRDQTLINIINASFPEARVSGFKCLYHDLKNHLKSEKGIEDFIKIFLSLNPNHLIIFLYRKDIDLVYSSMKKNNWQAYDKSSLKKVYNSFQKIEKKSPRIIRIKLKDITEKTKKYYALISKLGLTNIKHFSNKIN